MAEDRLPIDLPGLGEGTVRRPRHGDLDAGLVERLATLAPEPGADTALEDLVAQIVTAIVDRPDGVLAEIRAGGVAVAVEVADLIFEALDLTAPMRGQIRALAGARGGQCREHVLGEDGRPLRARLDGDPRPDCAFGCEAGRCLAERGPSVAAERIVRDWRLCGGARRTCWPRAGGLEDQAAEVVYWFQELDALAGATEAAT